MNHRFAVKHSATAATQRATEKLVAAAARREMVYPDMVVDMAFAIQQKGAAERGAGIHSFQGAGQVMAHQATAQVKAGVVILAPFGLPDPIKSQQNTLVR
jgi:hypothetical protein